MKKKMFYNSKKCIFFTAPLALHFKNDLQSLRRWINKWKTPGKKMKEEKRKDQSPNKRPHPKVQNTQWGALKEKTQNLGPKPHHQ